MQILVVALGVVWLYILGCFIAGDADIFNWPWEVRALYIGALVVYGIVV